MQGSQSQRFRSRLIFGAFTAGLLLSGCTKDFDGFLEKARKDFSDKNYISAIDGLNVGLLHWQESDGNQKKAEAYQILGQSYHYLRNTDKAIEAFHEAVKLSTSTFTSAHTLGMLHLTKNQIEPATQAFQSALRMKPDDPMSLLGLGNCYFALRKYKEAQATYQRILDTSPGVRDAMESLALVKTKLHQKPEAPSKGGSPSYKPPVKKSEPNVIFKQNGKKEKKREY